MRIDHEFQTRRQRSREARMADIAAAFEPPSKILNRQE